jgi:hypothetical protein
LHGFGANGAQNNTFLDSSANNFTITRNGNTTQGAFSPFSQPNGWWSNYFNQSGYLYNTSTSVGSFGTSNFTVEFWIYASSAGNGSQRFIYDTRQPGIDTGTYIIFDTSNNLIFALSGTTIATITTPPTNQWIHVAVCRTGTGSNQLTMYLNGSAVSSNTLSNNISSNQLGIGAGTDAPLGVVPFLGYISNFRIVNGTAVYTSNFTPPTAPLTAITNTVVLTCQSSRFVDNSASPVTLTVGGAPTVQSFYPFLPNGAVYGKLTTGGSAYFDGSGDQLNAPVSAISNVGSNNFSFECWVYALRQTNTFAQGLISYGPAGATSTSSCISFQLTSSGYLASSYAAGDSILLTDPALFPINQWTHCVVCRSGSTISLFKNGVRVATSSTSATVGSGGDTLAIGGQWFANSSDRQLQGYMSGIRILNGSSAYDATQSTLTVPTAPLTAITNTSLLLSATNGGIFDNASKNNLETVGDAQISTTQSKFNTSSMYFDGTGDYLTSGASSRLYDWQGNITVEAWIYPSSLNGSGSQVYGIVGTHSSSLDGKTLLYVYGNGKPGIGKVGVNEITGSAGNIVAGSWQHLAVVRSGSTTTIYVNGNSVGSGTTAVWSTGSSPIYIAYAASPNIVFNGYINDLRITNGLARYTTNFTPSAVPFPDI